MTPWECEYEVSKRKFKVVRLGFWHQCVSSSRQEPLTPFFGGSCSVLVTSSGGTLYKLLSLDSQLTSCRRQELPGQLELCLFCCQGFLLTQEKERKKKDEAGQSGVLPLPATGCSLPVRFWDEPSGTAEVQIEALFPIRKASDQAQLGVEPVLCAGGVHGVRPTLCGKGRAHGLFEVTNDHWECLWLDGKVLDFALGMANTHLSPLWTSIWSCWPWLAMLRPVLFIQWSPNLGSHASLLKQVGILQIPPCPWLWHTPHC